MNFSNMAGQAKAAMGIEALDVLADRGYFKGEEVLACEPLDDLGEFRPARVGAGRLARMRS